jgi:hypothetical protein
VAGVMSERRPARRLFAATVMTYAVGFLVWWGWPAFRESLIGKLVAIPPFSLYLLEQLGVPGLTDRSRCDWMWCQPTVVGVIVTSGVWLVAAWWASVGIARLIRSRRIPSGGSSAPPSGPAA